MEETIKYLLNNISVTTSLLFLIAFGIDILINSSQSWSERCFFWFLIFPVGLTCLYAGVFHIFYQDIAAGLIGWEPSPFEIEVGLANLSFAAMAILAAFYGFEARMILITGYSVFLWGAAIGHVRDMIVNSNYHSANAGPFFWTDILFPLVGIILLVMTYRKEGA
jgi:hypothetical protein